MGRRVLAVLSLSIAVAAIGLGPADAAAATAAGPLSVLPVTDAGLPDHAAYESVSCPTSDACVAGGYLDEQTEAPATARLSPAGTTIVPMATPAAGIAADVSAIACPTSEWCAALITYLAPGKQSRGLAARIFSAGSWGPATNLSSITYPDETSLSCPAVGACVATGLDRGNTLATLQNRSWTTQAVSSLADGSVDALGPVSCVSTGNCVAAGLWETSALNALVETDGVWRASAVVPRGGFSQLDVHGIDCVARNYCVAVGSASKASLRPAVAATYDGTSWSLTRIPSPADTDVPPTLVSCTAPGHCAALLSADSNGNVAAADTVDVLQNGTWSSTTLPARVDRPHIADGLACSSDGGCTVVGDRVWRTTLGGSGTEWTSKPVGFPTPPDVALTGIACPAASRCTAVGDSQTADGDSLIGEHLAGMWDESHAADIAAPVGVSCSAPDSCVATLGSLRAATWNGASWSVADLASPPDFGDADYVSISAPSCLRSGSCAAAVSFMIDGAAHFGVERLQDATWSYTELPLPHPAGTDRVNLIYAPQLSCVSTNWCLAMVGVDWPPVDGTPPPTETVDVGVGNVWTRRSSPRGTDGSGQYESLSCPVKGWCAATGRGQGYEPMADTYSDGRWQTQDLPVTGRFHLQDLHSVSCVDPGDCVSVGDDRVLTSDQVIEPVRAVVATLAGGSWTRQFLGDASGTQQTSLVGVSCPSSGECQAVGTAEGKDGGSHPVTTSVARPGPTT